MTESITAKGIDLYKELQGGAGNAGIETRETKTNFGNILAKEMGSGVQNTASALDSSTVQTIASMDGKASIADVTASTLEAEIKLKQALAIRDKIVEMVEKVYNTPI